MVDDKIIQPIPTFKAARGELFYMFPPFDFLNILQNLVREGTLHRVTQVTRSFFDALNNKVPNLPNEQSLL